MKRTFPPAEGTGRKKFEADSGLNRHTRGEPSPVSFEQFDAALLSAILETAVDGIITIDSRGRIRSANRAAEQLFGYREAELIGEGVELLMPEPYRTAHDGYLNNYLESGQKKIIGIGREVWGQHQDGSVFPMWLSVSEVRDHDERFFVGIVHDISERHELEASRTALIRELELANAELERFAYTVSHDLKSPLITIKGFLGAIERDAKAGKLERLSRDLARIEAAATKMGSLLDELLALSRIGRVANPAQDISMTKLAQEVVAMLEGPIAEHRAELTVAEDMGTVRGDRVRIGEVIQNSVENALKFSAQATPHPRIEIGARDEGGERVFTIRDNGVGVQPEYLDRIFRLFEQLDQSRDGTGIGLALAKRIIEVHEGCIWAESEGPGTGTTICFTIGTKETST